MDYWVLRSPAGTGGLVAAYPTSSRQIADWKYDEGIPLGAQYPSKGVVLFSKNYPDWRDLLDFQPNVLDALIISPKVRRVLEDVGVANVEYLSVDVLDHRRMVIGSDYAIANVLGSQPAIDMEKSEYRMNNIARDQIARMKRMVLAPERISPDAKLFRLKEMRTTFVVRDDLRQALEAAGATGCAFEQAQGWVERLL